MLGLFSGLVLLAAAPTESIHVVLEARYRTEISSEVTSTVERIEKQMGESFDEGDTLLLLDDKVYSANLLKAQAKVEETKVKNEVAKRLMNDKVISKAELTASKANLSEAMANLAIAEKQFMACSISAPYKGKVQQLFVQLYERVEAGQKLMEILDDSVLLARFYLPSSELPHDFQSTPLTFSIDELGQTRTTSVIRVAPAIDPASSLLKVEAEIDNRDSSMRSGMTGTLQLLTHERSHG